MKKTFYYTDELKDDFAATRNLKGRHIGETFPFTHKNPFWRFASLLAYRGLATPVAWLFCKLGFGLKIEGKAQVRGLKGGYFLYANHTQSAADAFIPSLVSFPKRTYIITGASAVSIPGLRNLVQMLGAIPLPSSGAAIPHFSAALREHIAQGCTVCCYPEAHIWPYYTRIRPFRSGSFAYPVRLNVPVVPYTVTYRKRRLHRRPGITVKVGAPVFPDPAAPERAERQRLRNAAYEFMTAAAQSVPQPEYIRYVHRTDDEN